LWNVTRSMVPASTSCVDACAGSFIT
jgi:hypothetical protein